MQNIQVRRYARPDRVGYQGTIEPEDNSWILFIPNEGLPQLWARSNVNVVGDHHIDLEFRPVLPSDPGLYWYVDDQSHSTETHTAFVEHKGKIYSLNLTRVEGLPDAPHEMCRKDHWMIQWLSGECHLYQDLGSVEHMRTTAIYMLKELDGKYSPEWLEEHKEDLKELMEEGESMDSFYTRMRVDPPKKRFSAGTPVGTFIPPNGGETKL